MRQMIEIYASQYKQLCNNSPFNRWHSLIHSDVLWTLFNGALPCLLLSKELPISIYERFTLLWIYALLNTQESNEMLRIALVLNRLKIIYTHKVYIIWVLRLILYMCYIREYILYIGTRYTNTCLLILIMPLKFAV